MFVHFFSLVLYCRYSMSYQQLGEFNYMAEEGEMADLVDELDQDNYGGEGNIEIEADEYDMVSSLSFFFH